MSAYKNLALVVCLATAGCAQTPQNQSAEAGHINWWPFGAQKEADKVADKDVEKAVNDKVSQSEAQSDKASHWWWPFDIDQKPAVAAAAAVPAARPMPSLKVTQAWLDSYEPKVREAIKGSPFTVERREDVLVVTAPIDSSFNPKRPNMLMPVTLGPITNVAKALETDPETAVLILGHADSTGAADANQKLSQERAQSVAAIFRLSGLQRNRLMLRGMGSVMPRAANDSSQGRALNRRVEIVLTQQETMLALLSRYDLPAPMAPVMLASEDTKAMPETGKKALPVKKGVVKKAPAKPAVSKKKPATPAKAKAPVKKTTTVAKKAPADTTQSN